MDPTSTRADTSPADASENGTERPVDEDLLGGFGLRCLVGSFDEFAAFERGAGADEGDQVGAVDRAPAVLGGLDQFERHGQPGCP